MRFLITALCSLALTLSAFVVGSKSSANQQSAPSLEAKIKLPPSYLPPAALPDSLALVSAPPGPGSAAFAGDEPLRRRRSGSRALLAGSWRQAMPTFIFRRLRKLSPAPRASRFRRRPRRGSTACSARCWSTSDCRPIAPRTITSGTRPFVVHKQSTCTPGEEKFLAGDGTYPSGHSAVGWGWALVLAELVPSRADAILQRGREFGHSRVVCNVHWQSDVEAGRFMASAAVARLHADPAFRRRPCRGPDRDRELRAKL